MEQKKGKFVVGQKFRKNKLSTQETSIIAEVYYRNKDTKIYTNIHHTKAFSKQIFKNDLACTKITFKNLDDKMEFTLTNLNLKTNV